MASVRGSRQDEFLRTDPKLLVTHDPRRRCADDLRHVVLGVADGKTRKRSSSAISDRRFALPHLSRMDAGCAVGWAARTAVACSGDEIEAPAAVAAAIAARLARLIGERVWSHVQCYEDEVDGGSHFNSYPRGTFTGSWCIAGSSTAIAARDLLRGDSGARPGDVDVWHEMKLQPGSDKADDGPYGIGGMDMVSVPLLAGGSFVAQHLLLDEPAAPDVGDFMRLVIRRFDLDPPRVAVYAPARGAPRAVATRGALWCALQGAIGVPPVLLATPCACDRVVPFRVTCGAGGGALPCLEVCSVVQPAEESEAPLRQLLRQRRLPVDIADALRKHRAAGLVATVSLRRYLAYLRFDTWQACPCAYLWLIETDQGLGMLAASPSHRARCESFVGAIVELCYPRLSASLRAVMVRAALSELGAFLDEVAEESDAYQALEAGLNRTSPFSGFPGSNSPRLTRVSLSMRSAWVRIESKFVEVWLRISKESHAADRAVLGDYADGAICPNMLRRIRRYVDAHKYRLESNSGVTFGRRAGGIGFNHLEARG